MLQQPRLPRAKSKALGSPRIHHNSKPGDTDVAEDQGDYWSFFVALVAWPTLELECGSRGNRFIHVSHEQTIVGFMTKGYKNDLAYIHDVGFGDYARNSAPGLLEILRSSGITTGLVVDLGSGSGLWARELDCAGYDVLGIDISPAMISIARKRVPQAEFQVGSLLKAKIPRCAVVTSLGECLNYLFDKNNDIGALRRLFRRVFKALNPGGLLVFDIAEPGRGKGPHQKHMKGPDWAVLVEVDEDTRTNLLTRRITSFRKTGEFYTRDEEVHRLHLYKRTDVAKELRNAGFRVQTVQAYGSQPMIAGCVGFIARKPTGGDRKMR